MLINQDKLMEVYRENYQMAWDDGHHDRASNVAWEWTFEKVDRELARIKELHQQAHEEAVNKAFYG